jgi:hypothetical protein
MQDFGAAGTRSCNTGGRSTWSLFVQRHESGGAGEASAAKEIEGVSRVDEPSGTAGRRPKARQMGHSSFLPRQRSTASAVS